MNPLTPSLPASLRDVRDRLAGKVLANELAAEDLPSAYAAEADEWLTRLFEQATGGKGKGFALIAVGGYGRSELCPSSDLDVALIHQRRRNVKQIADKLWYPIWDSGIKLDHSVRTPKEAIAITREDQRALLGLVDGRLVVGDADLATGVLNEIANWWRAHHRELLPPLLESARERHERFGEVPFLLEPDLKESAGGLRDIEALSLAARAVPSLSAALWPDGMDDRRRFLLGTRVILHAKTGLRSDRLTLQDQDDIAAVSGFEDADALMAAVAEAGREVMWASADAWRRINSYLSGPLGRAGGRDLSLDNGIVIRDATIALAPDSTLDLSDGTTLVRVAAAAAEYQMPVAAPVLERLVAAQISPPSPWDEELRQGFLSLLEFGPAATAVLESLDQRHLLERLIPEWLAVRNRPQRNAYHRFTVDRHLLEAVAEAALLIRSVRRPDLLLISALLHDIAKGRDGDHSVVGGEMARVVAKRMGFSPDDTQIIGRVVEHHLLLADAATRRDLDDPATVETVARLLSDRTALEVLAALTEADSIATGPTAWSPWKAGLVRDLASRTDAYLAANIQAAPQAELPPALGGTLSSSQEELASRGTLGIAIEGDVVTVVAPDRPGLLSLVAGTLALHRLSIRSATAMDAGNGMAVEVFGISRRSGDDVLDRARLATDLAQALDGQLLLETRLRNLESTYAKSRRPAAARPSEVRVIIDEQASFAATVIEVRAPDSHGLLHRLTRVLADSGLDVMSARVSTIGHEVVDAFYVRETGSGKRPIASDLEALKPLLEAEATPGS